MTSYMSIFKAHFLNPDSVVSCAEFGCDKRFRLLTKKCHCYRCGNLFCETHASFQRRLNLLAQPDPRGRLYPVCKHCFNEGKEGQEGASRSHTDKFLQVRNRSRETSKEDIAQIHHVYEALCKLKVGESEQRVVQWTDDTVSSHCMHCNKSFSSRIGRNKRHHCRFCGELLCDSCCSRKVALQRKSVRQTLLNPLRSDLQIKHARCCNPCGDLIDQSHILEEFQLAVDRSHEHPIYRIGDELRALDKTLGQQLEMYGSAPSQIGSGMVDPRALSAENLVQLEKRIENLQKQYTRLVFALKRMTAESNAQDLVRKNVMVTYNGKLMEWISMYRKTHRDQDHNRERAAEAAARARQKEQGVSPATREPGVPVVTTDEYYDDLDKELNEIGSAWTSTSTAAEVYSGGSAYDTSAASLRRAHDHQDQINAKLGLPPVVASDSDQELDRVYQSIESNLSLADSQNSSDTGAVRSGSVGSGQYHSISPTLAPATPPPPAVIPATTIDCVAHETDQHQTGQGSGDQLSLDERLRAQRRLQAERDAQAQNEVISEVDLHERDLARYESRMRHTHPRRHFTREELEAGLAAEERDARAREEGAARQRSLLQRNRERVAKAAEDRDAAEREQQRKARDEAIARADAARQRAYETEQRLLARQQQQQQGGNNNLSSQMSAYESQIQSVVEHHNPQASPPRSMPSQPVSRQPANPRPSTIPASSSNTLSSTPGQIRMSAQLQKQRKMHDTALQCVHEALSVDEKDPEKAGEFYKLALQMIDATLALRFTSEEQEYASAPHQKMVHTRTMVAERCNDLASGNYKKPSLLKRLFTFGR